MENRRKPVHPEKSYVERKIVQAMVLHGGNVTKVRHQIVSWACDDDKLLFDLVKPHINGIVSHAVERTLSKSRKKQHIDVKAEAGAKRATPKSSANDFGIEILKAVSSRNAATFGQESFGPRIRNRSASKRHEEAIRRMAVNIPDGRR